MTASTADSNWKTGEPGVFARRAQTVLTPHPGEAGRLLSRTSAQVQADRLSAGSELAARTRGVVVLKGEGTLTVTPAGRVSVNPTGTPLLATAGSGDVLAGALGVFSAGAMAQESRVAVVRGCAGTWMAIWIRREPST